MAARWNQLRFLHIKMLQNYPLSSPAFPSALILRCASNSIHPLWIERIHDTNQHNSHEVRRSHRYQQCELRHFLLYPQSRRQEMHVKHPDCENSQPKRTCIPTVALSDGLLARKLSYTSWKSCSWTSLACQVGLVKCLMTTTSYSR